jgi:hypothetical protein
MPKVVRIRGCLKKNNTKKKVKCHRCGGFGHFAKTCKEPEMGPDGETAAAPNKRYVFFQFVSVNNMGMQNN